MAVIKISLGATTEISHVFFIRFCNFIVIEETFIFYGFVSDFVVLFTGKMLANSDTFYAEVKFKIPFSWRGFLVEGTKWLWSFWTFLGVDSPLEFWYIFPQSFCHGSCWTRKWAVDLVLNTFWMVSWPSSLDILKLFFQVDSLDVKVSSVSPQGAGGYKSGLHFAESCRRSLSSWHIFILILFL